LIWLHDLLAATDGWLLGGGSPDQSFVGFCFDSRRARPGELFVALKTDRGDRHDFVADALARGATGALVEVERWSGPPVNGRLLIGMPDTYEALTRYVPCIGIVTTIGEAQLAYFGSQETIATKYARSDHPRCLAHPRRADWG
jgi:UDP-N-acetylmuramyl pentapeptide synthase